MFGTTHAERLVFSLAHAFRPGTESAAQGFRALAPSGGLPTAFFVLAVCEGAKIRAKALKRDARDAPVQA